MVEYMRAYLKTGKTPKYWFFCTVLVFLAIHQVFPQKNGLHREKPLVPMILPVFRYTLNVESTGGQKCGIGKKG